MTRRPGAASFRRDRVLAAAGILVASVAAVALFWSGISAGDPFQPGARKAAEGASLYREHCAACHGADLQGETPDWRSRDDEGFLPAPPHDRTGHTWHHPDGVLFEITKYGIAVAAGLPEYQTRMPAFESVLQDSEIAAVLAFIKSRWPDDIRERHDRLNESYRRRER